MEVSTFILCDAFNATSDGRFNVLGGGIDRIKSPAYPAAFSTYAFMMIDNDPAQLGPHTLELKLIDGQGKELSKLSAAFSMDSGMNNVVADRLTFQIAKPGTYRFDLRIDGHFQRLNRTLTAA